ncbi:helix-turn-helix transcriptional regulator [Kitasatospora xanthocidica]|uniref:helix-turn-helix transcriptional regulator n=1 Tax=Kitasatospora xanthocidica TaxID=83382 RepID=UPI0015F31AE5|nr:helix-turn-helix transcriptional regulator [Kitasatospora xanthocidica]
MAVGEVVHALKALSDFGLVRISADPAGPVVALHPGVAAEKALGAEEKRTRARAHRLEQLRSVFMACPPYYASGDSGEFLLDPPDVQLFIQEEINRATEEVLTVQPGGARSPETLEKVLAPELALLGRGVRRKILYQHSARGTRATQSFASAIVRAGGEVRTLETLPNRMIVIDRRLCLIPHGAGHTGSGTPSDGRSGPPAAAVIRTPSMVGFSRDLFQRLWDAATPFHPGHAPAGEVADELRRAVLHSLALGLTDEAASRRLGISTRTFRRHLAAVMQDLGATSRFQAAVIAIDRGLIDFSLKV